MQQIAVNQICSYFKGSTFFIHPVQPKFYDLLVINFSSITHAKLALSHMNIFCFNRNAGDSDLTNKVT